MSPLRLANLSLLIVFPVAWCAPLMRAGLLPLFGLSEISVLSGITSLWRTDIGLALIVVLFAILAPLAKVLTLRGCCRVACLHASNRGCFIWGVWRWRMCF